MLTIIVNCLGGYAQPRSESEALQIAQDFFGETAQARGAAPTASQLTLVSPAAVYQLIHPEAHITRGGTPNSGFYIFNDEQNKKFVIVSGDARQEDVLGYSENGVFTPDNVPCGLLFMLSYYNEEYDFILNNNITIDNVVPKKTNRASSGQILITTKWGQGDPYNSQIPSQSGTHCKTGCLATAMAQIMNYHGYPASGQGSVTNGYSNSTMNFSNTQFNWNAIRNNNSDAIALLMRACAFSVNMKWGLGESRANAHDASYALSHYFKYNANIRSYMKDYYSSADWENIIKKDLQNDRPILYYGQRKEAEGGHAWVIAGYNSSGQYYMNWGWEGSCDGWYSLSSLTLKNSNGSTSYDEYGRTVTYNLEQGMVCRIAKNTFDSKYESFFADEFTASNFTVGQDITLKFTKLRCNSPEANSFNTPYNGCIGYMLRTASDAFVIARGTDISIGGGSYYNTPHTYNINTSTTELKKGNYYYLYPVVFREGGTSYRIFTLNEESDWYLVYVDNSGRATLTRKGNPPSNPDPVTNIQKPSISVSQTDSLITLTTPTAGASYKYYAILKDQYLGEQETSIVTYDNSNKKKLPGNATIVAWGEKDGKKSNEATLSVNWFKVKKPVISQDGNKISITCATKNATIYYTINGSQEKRYNSPFTVENSSQITAYAERDYWNDSDIASYTSSPPQQETITITAKSYSRDYGEANPTFEYTVTGGTITGTPKLTCTATKSSDVGSYTITVEKGTVQGDAKMVNGTLTVTKAPLTVKANDCERYVGEDNPTFTLSYSGWKNGQGENVLTSKPTASCAATKSSAAGTYPIKVSGGSAKNYVLAYRDGTLTVKPKDEVEADFSGGIYYIMNADAGSDKMLSCGGYWGSHMVLDTQGLDFTVKKSSVGQYWNIFSGFISNIGTDGALGLEGFVDNYEDIDLTIKEVGYTHYILDTNIKLKVYNIVSKNGLYLTANTSNNLVGFAGNEAFDEKAQWVFITPNDLQDLRMQKLRKASKDFGVDATFLIKNPNINNAKDSRFSAWQMTGDASYRYGTFAIDTEPIFEVFRSYESYLYFWQKVYLPAGMYKLEVQGFYRDGDYNIAAQKRANNEENISAFLVAGENEVPLKSIFDEATLAMSKSWTTWTSQGYVPNTMNEAGYTFQTGAYNNELNFIVSKEQEMEGMVIGVFVRQLNSTTLNNWTAFDNFRLTYYGDETMTDDNQNDGISDAVNDATENHYYDMQGRKVSQPVKKGIYIVNGKKRIIK